EENMKRNLHLSGGAIAAEPLYLLLEKYGHTTAHEVSKALSHKAIESGKSLYEVAEAFEEINQYFAKFTDAEKDIIRAPEASYTGLAAQKALAIHAKWSKELSA